MSRFTKGPNGTLNAAQSDFTLLIVKVSRIKRFLLEFYDVVSVRSTIGSTSPVSTFHRGLDTYSSMLQLIKV